MRRLTLLLGVLSSIGCVTAFPPSTEQEKVDYWITMMTTEGQVVLTNQLAVAVAALPEEDVLSVEDYVPNTLRPGETSPFGAAVDDALRIAPPGVPFRLGPVPANETLTGTDGSTVSVPRWRGPFPVDEEVSTASFLERFPSARVGDVVRLNPRFTAVVIEIGEETTRYSIELRGPRPYPELGSEATLTDIRTPDGTSFWERVDVPMGASFRRPNDRVHGIPHGWYGVVAVDDESITLASLRSPKLEHAFKDASFVLEVVERT